MPNHAVCSQDAGITNACPTPIDAFFVTVLMISVFVQGKSYFKRQPTAC